MTDDDDHEDTAARAALDHSTVAKLDRILLPFLSLLFLVNSLDRSNLGNVETAHFTRDAGLQPGDLHAAVAWFFVFFVVLQPFAAAAGRRVGMGLWVPSVMCAWGVCTMLHVWVRSRGQLIFLRILIGALEAGFYPTTVSYLSLFYTRYEFARRLSVFYGQYAIAGALGGFVSYAVFSMFPNEGNEPTPGGFHAWQVLFLIEGGLTVIIAAIGFYWLPRSAGTAWFLSRREQIWAEERVRADRELSTTGTKGDRTSYMQLSDDEEGGEAAEDDHQLLMTSSSMTTHTISSRPMTSDSGLSKADILSAILALPLIIPLLLLNILSAVPSTAFAIFLPMVLSSLHLGSPIYANLLTVPPFLLAALTLFAFTHYSDRAQTRLRPLLAGLSLTIIGLSLLVILTHIPTSHPILKYITLCLLLAGSFIPSPLIVAWLSDNFAQAGTRAIILGINGWGNMAGVLAAAVFSPRFRGEDYGVSFWVTLVMVVSAWVGFWGFGFVIRRINEWKGEVESGIREDVEMEGEGWTAGRSTTRVWMRMYGRWERMVREGVGGRVLGMERDEYEVRRGGEEIEFRYSL